MSVNGSPPALVGLTGGIGSGKSRVASMFSDMGVPVIDLDLVGHQVTAPGSEGLASLVDKFGEEVLDGEALNRRRLAEIAFASEEKTKQLNAIVHPLIWNAVDKQIVQMSDPYVVIEASVLIESSGRDRVDRLVVVMADLETRKRRVLQREGMDEALFEAIINRQCSDAERSRLADDLIENNSGLDFLQQQVVCLHARLINQFGS